MKSDRSVYFPLGLALGTVFGALFGNPAAGALLGMVTGLVLSTSGRNGIRRTHGKATPKERTVERNPT